MALLGNISSITNSPGRFYGGVQSSNRSNWNNSGSSRNANFHWGKFTAIPLGYAEPHAWILAQSVGGLSTFTSNIGSGNITTAILALGKAIDANLMADISTTNAKLDTLAFLVSSISGSLNITDGNISTLAQISSSLAATGTITDANIFVIAGIFIDASISSGIALTNGQIGALVDLTSSITGTGVMTGFVMTTQSLSANIGGATPLSPEGLANAVWDSLLSNHVTAGTYGQLLADIKSDLSKKLDKGTFIALK